MRICCKFNALRPSPCDASAQGRGLPLTWIIIQAKIIIGH